MARVSPLERAHFPEEARPILAHLEGERGYIPGLYRTLAHSPALLRDFVQFTADLRGATSLDPKLRELAILAIARVAGTEIQWLAHLPLARTAGLTDAQIEALPNWAVDPAFSDDERAVIRFAEAAYKGPAVPDDTWSAAATHMSPPQMVELTLLAGFYTMVSRFLRTVEVETDPEYHRAAATPAAR